MGEYVFDIRVAVKGENAERVKNFLDARMKKEARKTYSNAIEAILVALVDQEEGKDVYLIRAEGRRKQLAELGLRLDDDKRFWYKGQECIIDDQLVYGAFDETWTFLLTKIKKGKINIE